jgi:hypothetical protein
MTKGAAWPQGAAVNDPGVIVFYTTNDPRQIHDSTSTLTNSDIFRLRGRKLKSRYAIFGAKNIGRATLDLDKAPYLNKYKWRRAYFIGHGDDDEFEFNHDVNNERVLKHPDEITRRPPPPAKKMYSDFIEALGRRLHPSKDPERPNEVGFLSCFTGESVILEDGDDTIKLNLITWVYEQLKAIQVLKKPKFPYLKVGGYVDFYRVNAIRHVVSGKITHFMDCITTPIPPTKKVPHPPDMKCDDKRAKPKARRRNEIPKYQVVKGPP